MIVEHHPQQGPSSVQLVAFDQLVSEPAEDGRSEVAAQLGIRSVGDLALAAGAGIPPISELAEFCIGGDLPAVNALNPYLLGASPSIFGDSSSYGNQDDYMGRTKSDVDGRIAAAVVPGGFLVVHGSSKAGKTRTAFEAVRQSWPGARLLSPIADADWRMIVDHPAVRSAAALVVWLDDIDRFFDDPKPLSVSVVDGLLNRGGPTVLIGTLRADRFSSIRRSGAAVDRISRTTLAQAELIELLSTAESTEEQAESIRMYPYGPSDWGLGERLSNAPELLQLYRESASVEPVLYVVVRVAIDWVRVGLRRPTPGSDLLELVREIGRELYPQLDFSDEDIEAGVARARALDLRGSRTALLRTEADGTGTRSYRPFDYLVESDEAVGNRPEIELRFWSLALERATSYREQLALGTEAFRRGSITVALEANKIAAHNGHVEAIYNVGVLKQQMDDVAGAMKWFRRAARRGHPQAMFNLALLVANGGTPNAVREAIGLYEAAARLGLPEAMFNLGVLLARRGEELDVQEAVRWYREAERRGHAGARYNLAMLQRRFSDG